jgi:DNA-binding CsgD family transcriptional regulator/tetratricopeptide (TPR) repeat protein
MELLDRDVALCDLEIALEHAMCGQGRGALVRGEAGIGKTTLVEHFVRQHHARARVLWGGCDAMLAPRLLGPLHDIAEQTGGTLGDVLAAAANAASRNQMFGAVLAELQRQPSIVVVEDLHWADEATLDVLRYLSRRLSRAPILLLLTYRDDEIGPTHLLRTFVGELASSATTVRVDLAPLSEQAVAVLVGPRAIDAAALHRQTGGNPFFVTEILADGGSRLPISIREAVLGRVARLSAPAMRLVDAAAVAGPRVEPWLLEGMLPAEFGRVEECLATGVLVEHGDGLAFRHDLARQAVLDSIPAVRRARLHRLVLDALDAVPNERVDVARLAHHAEGARDDGAILRYVPQAARQASAAGAHRAAADLLARGLRSAARLSGADLAELLEARAMECYHVADLPAAIDAWRQATDLWRDAGDRLRQGMNLAVLAAALASAGRRPEARQANQAAIELLATLPPGRELALAYGTQAILHQYNQELSDAIVLAERAISLAERAGDTRVLVMAYDTLGMSSMFLDYERGCRYLERARDLAIQRGDDAAVARAYGDLGAVSVALFRLDEAERYLADGLRFTAERDLDRTRLFTQGWLAAAHLYRGRWSEASAAALEVLARPASSSARVVALSSLGRLDARGGDAENASARLDEALLIAGTPEEFRLIAPVRAARAEARALGGDADGSRAEADTVYEVALQKRHPWLAGELAYWRWRAGARDRAPDWIAGPFALQMAGDWRAAAAAWRRLGCPYEEARALADGDDAARQQALAVFDRLGARPAAAEVRRALREHGIRRVPRGPRPTTRANRFGLTTRQLEILHLLVLGCTNAQIADRLSIAPKTVEHHVAAVLAKLDVVSRRAAVSLASLEHLF